MVMDVIQSAQSKQDGPAKEEIQLIAKIYAPKYVVMEKTSGYSHAMTEIILMEMVAQTHVK